MRGDDSIGERPRLGPEPEASPGHPQRPPARAPARPPDDRRPGRKARAALAVKRRARSGEPLRGAAAADAVEIVDAGLPRRLFPEVGARHMARRYALPLVACAL